MHVVANDPPNFNNAINTCLIGKSKTKCLKYT